MITSNIIQRTFNSLIPSWILGAGSRPGNNEYSQFFNQLQQTIANNDYNRYQVLGGEVSQVAPWDAYKYIVDGYMGNANVYAVIRMIAKTAATVPLYSYIIQDEKSYHKLKNLVSNIKSYSPEFMQEYAHLHAKAYELAGDQDELQILLDNPNTETEKQEFYTGSYIYKLDTGNSMTYIPKVPDGKNAGKVQGMYIMPVQSTTVVGRGAFPVRVAGYYLNADRQATFLPEEVIHSKYFNPDYQQSGGNLVGLSPLMALCGELEIEGAATLTEINQYVFGGPKVIVGLDDLEPGATGEAQIGQIKKAFAQEKEGAKNAGKWMIVPGKMNVHNVGISPVDLNIVERKKLTKELVCSVYGINPIVLGSSQASTESNVKQAIKSLYTNACLPEVYAMRDGINKKVVPIYNQGAKFKRTVDCDLSGISELQPDFKLLAETFATSPIFRPNDILEALKFGRSEDPNMEKYYIKSGYQSLDDLNMNMPPLTNMQDYTTP